MTFEKDLFNIKLNLSNNYQKFNFYKLCRQKAFITINDHKDHLKNNSQHRLLNPTKNISKINKDIVERVCLYTDNAMGLCKNIKLFYI